MIDYGMFYGVCRGCAEMKAQASHEIALCGASGMQHECCRVWCKRKAGSKLSGIVVTADSSAAPAARESQQGKSKDSMVYVGEDAEDMLNRLSSGQQQSGLCAPAGSNGRGHLSVSGASIELGLHLGI